MLVKKLEHVRVPLKEYVILSYESVIKMQGGRVENFCNLKKKKW